MDKKIILNFNPNIKIENLSEILKRRFPEYEQSVQTWGLNAPFIRLKKSMFVHAIVFIKHKEKKKQTIIGINGNMAPMAIYLFGFIFHYILRGDFLNNVEDAINQELG